MTFKQFLSYFFGSLAFLFLIILVVYKFYVIPRLTYSSLYLANACYALNYKNDYYELFVKMGIKNRLVGYIYQKNHVFLDHKSESDYLNLDRKPFSTFENPFKMYPIPCPKNISSS